MIFVGEHGGGFGANNVIGRDASGGVKVVEFLEEVVMERNRGRWEAKILVGMRKIERCPRQSKYFSYIN